MSELQLSDLSAEIIIEILQSLDLPTISKLSSCSKFFNYYCKVVLCDIIKTNMTIRELYFSRHIRSGIRPTINSIVDNYVIGIQLGKIFQYDFISARPCDHCGNYCAPFKARNLLCYHCGASSCAQKNCGRVVVGASYCLYHMS